MKKIIKNAMIIGVCISVLLVGCSEDYLEIQNENTLQADNLFTNIENLDLSLNSVYSSIKAAELFGSEFHPKVLEMLPHTFDQDWLGTAAWNQMAINEITQDNSVVMAAWRGWYRVVERANDFIENAIIYKDSEYAKESEAATVDQMLGQAYCIRAYAYFSIVRLWGEGTANDVSKLAGPLILKVATTMEEMEVPRATIGEIYTQVIADFEEAEKLLPENWNAENAARVDKYAAKGFLGKVYLYKEDYQKAKDYLGQVVNGSFQLVDFDQYNGLFHGETEFSSESIWEVNFATDMSTNTWQGGTGSNIALITAPFGTGWSNVWPHDENIKRFGSDPRLHVCALEPGVDQVVYGTGETVTLEKFPTEEGGLGWSNKKYVPLTYSVYSTNRNYGANYHIMRLADVYLMYAEALNALGEDATAMEYTNKVRRRAYAKDFDTPDATVDFAGLTGTQLRDSIREERFRELFNEGQRWYDIVRWGIAEEECAKYDRVRSGVIKFDNPKDTYLPVPLKEIEANPAMKPSTGYGY